MFVIIGRRSTAQADLGIAILKKGLRRCERLTVLLSLVNNTAPLDLLVRRKRFVPKAYPVDSGDLHNGPDKRLGRR